MDIAQLKSFLNPDRMDSLISWGMNILLAIVILIIGLWISKRVQNAIIKLSQKSPQMDETLFKFLASIARWVIMAFVLIAVLNRFGIETTSIVALLGAGGLIKSAILSMQAVTLVMLKKFQSSRLCCRHLIISRLLFQMVKFGVRKSSITAITLCVVLR